VRYLLVLRNGQPATPAALVTIRASWEPGDTFVARRGASFRIVDTEGDVGAHVEPDVADEWDGVWTVDPVADTV
jgi:hypothetical protein